MGIAAIYPKRHTSQPQPLNRIYPYLLSHLEISRPDQVWASDITYICTHRSVIKRPGKLIFRISDELSGAESLT